MSSSPDDKDKNRKSLQNWYATDLYEIERLSLADFLEQYQQEVKPSSNWYDALELSKLIASEFIKSQQLLYGGDGGGGGAGAYTGRYSSNQPNKMAGYSPNIVIIDDILETPLDREAKRLKERPMTLNIKDTKSAVMHYLKADIPCFLWGAPGVGKSDAVRQIADDTDQALIDFRAILRDPVDMRGLPSIDRTNGVAKWLPPSDLPNEKRDGKRGILFMDELNAASQAVQAACFGLVLDRKVGEYRLPPGWRIIAAGNRQSDKAAAQRMPTALANRFAHIDVTPTVDDFTTWANANDLDPMIVAFIRFRPALLHSMEGDGRTFPTPRAWANVAKLVANGIPDNLRHRLVAGLVGEGASGEFEAFVRIYSKLPSLDHILINPKGADVPTEPAALYAIASGLSRKATQQNFGNALTYMARTKKEFEVMFAVDSAKRDPKLSHTKAFVDWASRNNSVLT